MMKSITIFVLFVLSVSMIDMSFAQKDNSYDDYQLDNIFDSLDIEDVDEVEDVHDVDDVEDVKDVDDVDEEELELEKTTPPATLCVMQNLLSMVLQNPRVWKNSICVKGFSQCQYNCLAINTKDLTDPRIATCITNCK